MRGQGLQRRRWAVVVGALAFYAVFHLLVAPFLAPGGAAIFGLVPLIVVGRFFGVRGAIAAGLVVFPLDALLLWLSGFDVGIILSGESILGHALTVIAGGSLGYAGGLQLQLSSTQARVRQTLDFSPMGIALLDLQGRYAYVNQAYERIYGWKAKDLIGRSPVDMVVPLPERVPVGRVLDEVIRTGTSSPPKDWEQRTRTGTRVVVRHHFDVQRDVDGEVSGLLVASEDVTGERDLIHEQGRTSRTVLRVAEGLPDLVVIVRDGRMVWANEAFASTMGFSSRELVIGESALLYIAEDEREELLPLLELAAEAPVASKEIGLLTREGREFRAEVAAVPAEFEGEWAVMVIARDISDRHALEDQVRQLDRMACLGTLAAGVAHEINNPLAYIHLNLHYAIDQVDGVPGVDAAVVKGLRDALDGANRVRAIITELRTFSHVDTEMVAVDVEAVIDGALRIVEHELRHNARVVRDYGNVPPVFGNQGRLSQVFLNVITNALHAIEEQGAGLGEIRVRTELTCGKVVVEIGDSGPGIPPESIGQVFDPFFTTKPTGRGTGLGLAVCRNIAEEHDGTIEVVSPPGQGALFTVRLSAAPGAVRSPKQVAPMPVVKREGLRLLIVDDDIRIARAIRRSLGTPHAAEIVCSATAAIELLDRDDEFDLVLCDLVMGETSGADVHDWIARERPKLFPKLVLMSGGAFTTETHDLIARTGRPLLRKPFELSQVIEFASQGATHA